MIRRAYQNAECNSRINLLMTPSKGARGEKDVKGQLHYEDEVVIATVEGRKAMPRKERKDR